VEEEFTIESVNGSTAYTEAFCSSLARFAGMVSLDKVVNVTESNFTGHVYNLQTNSEWYIVSNGKDDVNGIIVHNCRCLAVGEVGGYSPELQAERDKGLQPRQTLKSWIKDQGLTKNRFGQKYNIEIGA